MMTEIIKTNLMGSVIMQDWFGKINLQECMF